MTSLLLPFASNDSRRVNIFCWVQRRWAHLFPGWQLCLGRDSEEDFNRSRARNEAFKCSTGDILVLSDADTICTPGQIVEAIRRVQSGVPWVVAHDKYYSLTEHYTNELLTERPDVDLGSLPKYESNWVMTNTSQAGVLVIPREGWEKVGGYDERFKGWGYEDNEFAVRLDREWGFHQRVSGPMLHLWHDPGENFSQPHIAHNELLYQKTVAA